MEDNTEENILKEIRTIIGCSIYDEMKEGKNQKEAANRSKFLNKRKEGEKYKSTEGLKGKDMMSIKKIHNEESRKRKWKQGTEGGNKENEKVKLENRKNIEEIRKKKRKGHWSLIRKNEVCKFYFLKGKCKNEEHCLFSHDITPLYKLSKLCKFQLKGECTRPKCPFSHDIRLFYCRNDLIGGSCTNPSCEFKHAHIDMKAKDQKTINAEVDKVLSTNDKVRFVFNNKNFIMDILIRNYFNFPSFENVNFHQINKDDNYPWYINSAIDLLKVDLQQNKVQYFYHLLENYIQEKKRNLLRYVDDEKLKLQVQKEILPHSTHTVLNNEQEHKEHTTANYNATYIGNKKPNSSNETNNGVDEYKFWSSDDDEDYSKYLNTYLEIKT